ncbi:MAG: hypothetical protein ACFE8M_02280 [Candidatus Hermodarchaeota archaeon]
MNMHYCNKKPKKIRSLSVLFFIFLCLPIAFIFILLRFIPQALPLMEAYINSGSSIFIPFIPNINLLPEKNQLIGLTLGHLIDIIIIAEILGFIEISIYHLFKKKYFNEQFNEFSCLDLNCLPTGEELYLSVQEREGLFGVEYGLYPFYNVKLFDNNKARSYKIIDLFFNKKNYRRFDAPTIYIKKFKLLSYIHFRKKCFSFYHANFNSFRNSHLENPYPHYIINITSIPYNQIDRRGKLYE